MDLIRQILANVEAVEVGGAPVTLREPNAAYQAALLNEAGLIEAAIVNDNFGNPRQAIVRRLTWTGHDFLDAVRDDTVWKKVKENVIKPGVSWTFGIVLEYAKQEIQRRIFGTLPAD